MKPGPPRGELDGGHASLGNAGPRCETGEELLRKGAVPTIDQAKQTTGCAKVSARGAERCLCGATEPSKRCKPDVGSCCCQSCKPCAGVIERAQIRQPPPDGGKLQAAFVDDSGLRWSDVGSANVTVIASDPFVGHVFAVDILPGKKEQTVASVTFIGECESRASR